MLLLFPSSASTNVLDTGGGIISSQGGHFPLVDEQLGFLTAELERLKPERQAGKRTLLIVTEVTPWSNQWVTSVTIREKQDPGLFRWVYCIGRG